MPVSMPIWGDFEWSDDAGGHDADGRTTGKLRLYVDGRPVWGSGPAGIEWTWRELLAGLSQSWDRLLFEPWIEGPASSGRPGAREQLVARGQARVSWGEESPDWLEARDEAAFEWEQAHELSRFLPGTALPEVFIFAVEDGVEFATAHASVVTSPIDAGAALSALGDQIAGRLEGSPDTLARELVQAWHARRKPATDAMASVRVGVPEAALRHARGPMAEAEAWGDARGSMCWTAYLATVQACRRLGRHSMAIAVSSVASLPGDGVWSEAHATLSEVGRLTGGWMRGAAEPLMAHEVRGLAGVKASEPVPLTKVAKALGVEVEEAELDEAGFPGLAVHTPGRAPLLLLNSRGFDAAADDARRFATAVGISRLLAAAQEGAIEAFALEAGRPDRRRHRVAIELLLPMSLLEEAVLADQSPGTLERICERFGVGLRLAALQVQASRVFSTLSPEDLRAAEEAASDGPLASPPRRPAAKLRRVA